MHTRHDSILVIAIVAILAGLGFVAYQGELTIRLDFVNSMIAFHFFEVVLAITLSVFIFRMSHKHSHHLVRSIFSPNFIYINIGMILFVASTAWYLYSFVSAGFGSEFTPETIHLVGSSTAIFSMLFIVKGLHKIYRDFIIKM